MNEFDENRGFWSAVGLFVALIIVGILCGIYGRGWFDPLVETVKRIF